MLIALKVRPGIVKDLTDYSNSGGWYDCDKVRFQNGLPQKIGGWQKLSPNQFSGIARSILWYSTLSGSIRLGLGTNTKYYVIVGQTFYNVTPIRRDVTLGSNPFASTSTLTTLVVTDTGHGAAMGDYVTFSGATTFAGIPAGDLNTEHQIISVTGPDTYVITVATPANATTSGGGTPDAAYQINIGPADAAPGSGWGTGTWGRDEWGSGGSGSGPLTQIRIWSNDTYGEDVVINPRDGAIYYIDSSAHPAPAEEIGTMVGASDTPVVAREVMVSDKDRHVIAFGTNPRGSSTQDLLLIRWSNQEDIANWTPSTITTAGDFRIGVGSEFIAAEQTRSQIVIWTDISMHSMQWVGGEVIFAQEILAMNVSLAGPNAMVTVNDTIYFMGKNQFYKYDGQVNVLNSPVQEYVFNRLDAQQIFKTYTGINAEFNEVTWYYQSVEGTECDSYVTFNYVEDVWTIGTLNRTVWTDRSQGYNPIAAADDGYLYYHEVGSDDGSDNPPLPIVAHVESSPIELSDDKSGPGDFFMFIGRLIPDITFQGSSNVSPTGTLTVKMRDWPGGEVMQDDGGGVTMSAAYPIELFTNRIDVRLRGRSAILRFESDGVGTKWRLGTVRMDARADGRR